ncbi:hypothetical protein A5674_04170 [Mycobacterium malmoense]|uniref:hypothetical protein n=1 Tax=Mycobacterium malmoense TaxID=1780 RepID=UPI00080B7B06|nr:hypothetical protein [Mycobacterium malmoense]OCB20819.1 hypothetical protein A5674_04170 [Mycobacterium malmoense]
MVSKPTARWIDVRDALRGAPPAKIRVLCPRGDFIVNVQVVVPQVDILGGDNPAIFIAPCAADGRSLGNGQTLGDVYEGQNPQFRMYTDHGHHVFIRCRRGKCRYTGTFNYDGLAVDLAASVLGGHPEHQLIQ